MYSLIKSSQDLLFIIISFCALLLTIFLVWFLSYLIKIIRDVSKLVNDTQEKIEKIGKVIDLAKEKIDHSAGHFMLFMEAMKELVKFIAKKRTQKSESDNKKKKT